MTDTPAADSPAVLDSWVQTLASRLDLDPSSVPTALLLDLTREAAHGVVRPAGPLTTYLLGIAVANGRSPEEAAELTRAAIAEWAG